MERVAAEVPWLKFVHISRPWKTLLDRETGVSKT